MYNEERKMRFLEEEYTSPVVGMSIFTTSEPYEREAGKDLCELEAEILQDMTDHKFGIRTRTLESTIGIIRSYVTWCEKQGYPTCNGINEIEVRMDKKMRRYMVASPKHLQAVLDEAFSPVDEQTVDCLYRCYIWMVYSGMLEDDALNVKTDEVKFYSMTIEHGGKSYEIYREAASAFHLACEAEEFKYKHPKYETMRKRYAGEYLMRGVRSEKIDVSTVRRLVAVAFQPKGISLSYKRIRLSGIFYRAYELERMGSAVNFDKLAEEHAALAGGSYHRKKSKHQAKYTFKSDLADDYANWKKIFT